MKHSTAFGNWLRQRRRTFDITQHELAERVGCSVASIRKFESGERKPSRQIVELLADQIGISFDERDSFALFARTDRGTPHFKHPQFRQVAPILESNINTLDDKQIIDPLTMRWIALHDDCPPLPLGKKPLICSVCNRMNAPGSTQALGDSRIMCQLHTTGQVDGDLCGTMRQELAEISCEANEAADRLSSLNTFFSIETSEGVIKGFCSGSFYEQGTTAYIQQHGRILSVTRAYADLFDANVYYRSEVPLVITDNGKEGFQDRGTLTIAPI